MDLRGDSMNGIQIPIAIAGTWVTLMALIVARRKRAQARREQE
jgi:hypothetical protein